MLAWWFWYRRQEGSWLQDNAQLLSTRHAARSTLPQCAMTRHVITRSSNHRRIPFSTSLNFTLRPRSQKANTSVSDDEMMPSYGPQRGQALLTHRQPTFNLPSHTCPLHPERRSASLNLLSPESMLCRMPDNRSIQESDEETDQSGVTAADKDILDTNLGVSQDSSRC